LQGVSDGADLPQTWQVSFFWVITVLLGVGLLEYTTEKPVHSTIIIWRSSWQIKKSCLIIAATVERAIRT
jgi:hypothetical protein